MDIRRVECYYRWNSSLVCSATLSVLCVLLHSSVLSEIGVEWWYYNYLYASAGRFHLFRGYSTYVWLLIGSQVRLVYFWLAELVHLAVRLMSALRVCIRVCRQSLVWLCQQWWNTVATSLVSSSSPPPCSSPPYFLSSSSTFTSTSTMLLLSSLSSWPWPCITRSKLMFVLHDFVIFTTTNEW